MIKLPSELSISDVETLHQHLLNELISEEDVCLDISEVKRADTASIQLLCALQKHLLTVEHKIIWQGKSDALQQAITNLGLSHYLVLDSSN